MNDQDSVPPITGVAEIVLNVKSIPPMKAFYSDVLGFPVFNEACIESAEGDAPDGEPTITFLTISPLPLPLGATHPQLLALIDYQRHYHAKSSFSGHAPSQSTLNHLSLIHI